MRGNDYEEIRKIQVLCRMEWDNAYGNNWDSVYGKLCCRTCVYFM